MSLTILFFVLQLFAWSSRVLLASEKINNCISTTSRPIMMKIGAVLDLDSLVGKQQKIAMEIAVQEFNSLSCSKLDLNIQNSRGISARAIASGNFSSPNFFVLWVDQTQTSTRHLMGAYQIILSYKITLFCLFVILYCYSFYRSSPFFFAPIPLIHIFLIHITGTYQYKKDVFIS